MPKHLQNTHRWTQSNEEGHNLALIALSGISAFPTQHPAGTAAAAAALVSRARGGSC